MENYYKKLYEETIEKLRKLHIDWCSTQNSAAKEIEESFPELRELEDEKIIKELIAIFKGEIHYTSEKDTKRYIAWLEKQGEQPSWSEEDEEMKLDTIKAFQLAYPYATEEENPRKRNIDWLKSIKSNHWKPSEEQILSLKEAISIVGENSISGRNLIEILEQLEKF